MLHESVLHAISKSYTSQREIEMQIEKKIDPNFYCAAMVRKKVKL